MLRNLEKKHKVLNTLVSLSFFKHTYYTHAVKVKKQLPSYKTNIIFS